MARAKAPEWVENGNETGIGSGNGPETSERHALHAELVRGPDETPRNQQKGPESDGKKYKA